MRRRSAMCACGHPPETRGGKGQCLVIGCGCRQHDITPKRNKYNAVRVVGPLGELYDSKAERDYGAVLESRCFEPGVVGISRWGWAPRFVLQDEPLITYRPDFIFWTLDGRPCVVDVKGHAARDFSLRVRMWKNRYPTVPLCVVKNGVEAWQ